MPVCYMNICGKSIIQNIPNITKKVQVVQNAKQGTFFVLKLQMLKVGNLMELYMSGLYT